MSKYMTVEGVTFKKTDLKRVEQVQGTTRAYVYVTGRKQEILVVRGDSKSINEFITNTILCAEEK